MKDKEEPGRKSGSHVMAKTRDVNLPVCSGAPSCWPAKVFLVIAACNERLKMIVEQAGNRRKGRVLGVDVISLLCLWWGTP